MIEILMLLMAQATQPPVIPGTVTIEQNLNIPDEIAPAMIPYVNCRVSSRGVPMFDERGEAIKALVPKGGDCTAHRKQAAKNADTMLRRYTNQSRKERRDLIDKTLSAIDQTTTWPSAPQTEEHPNAAN